LIPLANQVNFGESSKSNPQLALPNGDALPPWLVFDAMSKILKASSVPAGALPLGLVLKIQEVRYLLVISERGSAPSKD
jgi:hypothetical protein